MGHQLNQYDIPDRQLLATSSKPRVDVWTDIGEAKITYTIFGRAKVRVVREKDKKRRAWMVTVLALLVISVAVWQGGIALQNMQNSAPPLSLSERIRGSAQVFQSVGGSPHASPPLVMSKPEKTLHTEIDKLMGVPKIATHLPPGLNVSEQKTVKQVMPQPLKASIPQTASLAANNNALINQTDMRQSSKQETPIQPVATIVAAPAAMQPAESKLVAPVSPPVKPLLKDASLTPSPSGENQLPGPGNIQP